MAQQGWDRRRASSRDAERDRLLAEWVRGEVVPFSPFWAARLAGVKVRGAADLASVPVIEEGELAAAGGPGNPELLLLPTEDGFKRHASRAELLAAARELRTGGEDARRLVLFRRYKPVHVHQAGVVHPLAVAYTRTDLDRLHLAGARLVEVAGLGADDALVNGVPAGPSVAFWGLYHAALAARMTALHPRADGRAPVLALAQALQILPATVLALPVGEAVDLLCGLADRGVPAERVRTVLTVGPPPDTDVRAQIVEAARELGAAEKVRVQAVWAPASARALWAECRPPSADPTEATYGLHTYPDMDVLEVRDVNRGRPAGENEPGELVLTSPGWRGTALVRTATGAWTAGLVTTAACPNCRRTVPRVAPSVVEAAWQPRVSTPDGPVHVDLRRAPAVLTSERLRELDIRDWSLRAVDGELLLGLDLATHDREAIADLAYDIGEAVGAVPEVHLGAGAAGVRPQLGEAGPEA